MHLWFGAVRPLAAAMGVWALLVAGVPVARADGPTIVHRPVTISHYQTGFAVQLDATCAAACRAFLMYRTTPLPGEDGTWTRLELTPKGDLGLGVRRFSGNVPANVVTTRGVDYYLEVIDRGIVSTSPDGAERLDSSSDFSIEAAGTSWYHVHTLSPPAPVHDPPPYVPADKDLTVDLRSGCSTGACSAELYFRTSPEFGFTDSFELWEHVPMQVVSRLVAATGDTLTWRATIPARIVDVRGVDYAMKVLDGHVEAWSPGTAYQGYRPWDGTRVLWHHAHVFEPSRIEHEPVGAVAYRSTIPVSARASCPARRSCTARLYYRTANAGDDAEATAFSAVDMSVRVVARSEDENVVAVAAVIPASVVDTRGVDYFFSVSDGSTTAWWPGTSQVDGYVALPGTRVAYEHVRVLEPPHIIAEGAPLTRAGAPFLVRALVSCATGNCLVDLFYSRGDGTSITQPRSYTSVPMSLRKVADVPSTPFARYEAEVPAAAVTTSGLGWFVRAADGYVSTFSPGTPYSGAYIALGDRRAGAVGTVDAGVDVAWFTRVF